MLISLRKEALQKHFHHFWEFSALSRSCITWREALIYKTWIRVLPNQIPMQDKVVVCFVISHFKSKQKSLPFLPHFRTPAWTSQKTRQSSFAKSLRWTSNSKTWYRAPVQNFFELFLSIIFFWVHANWIASEVQGIATPPTVQLIHENFFTLDKYIILLHKHQIILTTFHYECHHQTPELKSKHQSHLIFYFASLKRTLWPKLITCCSCKLNFCR